MPGFRQWLETPAGRVPVVSGLLTWRDRLGAWKARWGIGRFTYLVPPGLYAVGAPDRGAPVVVTANYQMSYDLVRQALAGRNVWLLVLETYGINVWCAAGKGTFGTGELVRRLESSRLAEVVEHRRLVLPLLGAAGVRAVEVRQRSGFDVGFGPIHAVDLPAYLDGGCRVTPAMRQLTFTPYERLVLTPVELVQGVAKSVPFLALLAAIGFLAGGDVAALLLGYLGALVTGAVLTPLLLPLLPGRSFAFKGWLAGCIWTVGLLWLAGPASRATILLACCSLPVVSAFHALTFTGSTPFTSQSGVRREMRLALPAMALSLLLGIGGWLLGRVP